MGSGITSAVTPTVASVTSGAGGGLVSSGGGGILGGFGRTLSNPIVAGQLISGIGAGLSQNSANKARERELERIAGNYEGIGDTLYRLPEGQDGQQYQQAADKYDPAVYGGGKVRYNPQTKRIEARTG